MSTEVHAHVSDRLARVEQRYTAHRRALVDLLVDAGRPLTIADVRRAAPDLPQSSVYRNLTVLEQAGAVLRVAGADGLARYELTEELTEHHHHLVCVSCGAVEDFTASPRLERTVTTAVDQVADETGFRPHGHRLDIVGTCARCR